MQSQAGNWQLPKKTHKPLYIIVPNPQSRDRISHSKGGGPHWVWLQADPISQPQDLSGPRGPPRGFLGWGNRPSHQCLCFCLLFLAPSSFGATLGFHLQEVGSGLCSPAWEVARNFSRKSRLEPEVGSSEGRESLSNYKAGPRKWGDYTLAELANAVHQAI